jgi:hypothetical protein
MWLIANKTPFVADHAWVIDKEGNKLWMVVVKAAFDVSPDGRCYLSGLAEPVRPVAKPFGEFGKSSVRYEADLLGPKPRTDILVLGDAVAPQGRMARALDVVLQVGSVRKTLRVTGNRTWEANLVGGLRMSDPEPFERIPITYERAYGGWDTSASDERDHRLEARNPVGTGFAVRVENSRGASLPNVEDPERLIRTWSDRPAPAGFNVVDCAWSPRRELAGTYDDKWRQQRFPMWAEDFNPRYHNCAPRDQQTPAFLRGGERVDVIHMSPGGKLSFTLPRIDLAFRTRFGGERIDHEGQLCTVLIEPNRGRLVMAWQTTIVCNRRADELDETLVVEKWIGDGSTNR